MIKPAVSLAYIRPFVLLAAGLLGCTDEPASDVPSSSTAGEEGSSSSASGSRGDAGTKRDASVKDESSDESEAEDDASGASSDSDERDERDDQVADDNDASEPADDNDAGEPADDDAAGGSTGTSAADDQGGSAGEVVTTESGTKIYLDPNCESITPMIMGMSLELVGCCLEGGMCGLSNHKLMLPPAVASMFPVKCDGYDMLASFGLEAPKPKSCTFPH